MLGITSKRRWLATLALPVVVLALGACGGGGSDEAGVGSGGTGTTFSSGRITGFGSVIVNGVHYDDDGADVFDDHGGSHGSDALKLGMVVEIEAGEITTDPVSGERRASASSIRYASELKGPVEAIDVAAGTLTVLGQTVTVDADTVFDDSLSGGLAAVRVGDLLEIYGFLSGDGRYTASRIEDDDDADEYKLRGVVADLDAAASTFRIGSAVIAYAGASELPAGLADGQYVRVEVDATPNGDGQWVALRVQLKHDTDEDDDADEAEVEGFITSVDDAVHFSVNGQPVDASGVTGLPAGLALGVRVEVEGQLVDGVLVARKVELEDEDDEDEGGEFEVEGTVESLDPLAQTFVLRGVTVSYSGEVRFDDGTAIDLVDGAHVEVEGRLADDGHTLQAERIKFED